MSMQIKILRGIGAYGAAASIMYLVWRAWMFDTVIGALVTAAIGVIVTLMPDFWEKA